MLLTGFFFIGICGEQRLIAEDLLFKEFIFISRGLFAIFVSFNFYLIVIKKKKIN